MKLSSVCLFILSALPVLGVFSCPSQPITIAGAASVQRLTEAWKRGFTTFNHCPSASILINGGGSFVGAARVCGTHKNLPAVDIGGMARQLNYGDATTRNGYEYQCQRSPRKLIELAVAQEGIALVTAGSGAAADCIRRLGGLSLPQLRWIYSSYTKEELINDYWDESSVPFEDGDDETHLWSELHEDCEPTEILLAGMVEDDPAYEFFLDVVLEGRDETFAFDRTVRSFITENYNDQDENSDIVIKSNAASSFYRSSSVKDMASYLLANEAAISFIQLGHLFSDRLLKTVDRLSTASIRNQAGDLIDPKASAFESSSYPLSRRLYLNVLDDATSLTNMKPFLEFALSDEGTKILKASGFWPLHDWERIVMATRAQIQGGVPMSDIQMRCGPRRGHIAIAGSSTVKPVARIWEEIYSLGCPKIDIELEGGGSSAGAGRVCANSDKGSPVDIGNMSRDWKQSEAAKKQGFLYGCLKGDTTRSAIRVAVALDGITVVMRKGGVGEQCMELLGGGLTLDQIRWIYSNYNDDELKNTGWDPKSLKNSDNDSSTHLWSELDSRCSPTEIRIAGGPLGDGTYTSFVKAALVDQDSGEDIDVDRPYGYREGEGFSLASYLRQHDDAISYLGFNYYFDNKSSLSAAPIRNIAGVFVAPTATTIADGSYTPFVRKIWMNLLNDKDSLQNTVPMVKFGFSNPMLVSATGYVPLTDSDAEEMIERLDQSLEGNWSDDDSEDKDTSIGLVLGLVSLPATLFLGFAVIACFMWRTRGKEEDDASTGS